MAVASRMPQRSSVQTSSEDNLLKQTPCLLGYVYYDLLLKINENRGVFLVTERRTMIDEVDFQLNPGGTQKLGGTMPVI